MKRFLASQPTVGFVATLILVAATVTFTVMPIAITGCSTTQTQEAKAFYSYKDTWTIAKTAYDSFCERVVQGKVSKQSEQEADIAWNLFRDSFREALIVAQQTQSSTATAPEQVRVNANNFLAATKRL